MLLTGNLYARVGPGRGVGDQLADPLAEELRVEKLLGVLPLVERLALVEPFVALKPNQRPPGDLGQRLRQLGLADTGRPFDENGPSHAGGQVHDGGDAPPRDVARTAEPLL